MSSSRSALDEFNSLTNSTPQGAIPKKRTALEEFEELTRSAFDPEGVGYDYESALAAGLSPDKTGHWPSRVPDTGLLLKGRKHETWSKTEAAEEGLGYEIYKEGNRYYSRLRTKQSEPQTESTSNKVFDQFLDGVVNEFTFGLKDIEKAEPKGGLETTAKVAGRVVGMAPSVLIGAGLIGQGLKLTARLLPPAAKAIVALATRVGFTGASVWKTAENSIEFKQALDAGDMEAASEAAAGTIVDSAFAFLMTKGWIKDAKQLKDLHTKWMAERFARAKNITPEPPKQLPAATLAEAKAQAKVPSPIEVTPEPSPELRSAADAKDLNVETSRKIKEVKVKKVPETEEQRKIRLEKARAVRIAKAAAKPKITRAQQRKITRTRELADLGYDNAQISFKMNIPEKAVAELKAGRVPVIEVPKAEPKREDVLTAYRGVSRQKEGIWVSGIGAQTEGKGVYLALTKEHAKNFGDRISEIKYRKPKKVLTVQGEELPLLDQTTFSMLEPIEKNDSVWIKANKQAAKDVGFSLGNWTRDVQDKYETRLSEILKGQGYDAVSIRAEEGHGWDILLDKNLMISEEIGDVGKISEPTPTPPVQTEAEKAFEKMEGEIVKPPTVPEPTEEDALEKYFGKPIDQITDAEIDDYIKMEVAETEPLTEVDTQTGSPSPSELSEPNESVFDASKEAVAERTKIYTNNKSIATDIDDALGSGLIVAPKDIAATGWKLANDVNRWKYGEAVDIDKTRDFLSEIAGRADEFIGQFESTADFADWKETIQEMAKWARGVDQIKNIRTGTTLYSGIPVGELYNQLKKFIGNTINFVHNIDDIRNISNRTGDIKLFHGAPRKFAEQLVESVKSGKPVFRWNSAEQMARYVSKLYNIPYIEFINRTGARHLVESYSEDKVSKMSTAPAEIASRWARAFPYGEILSDLNTRARLYTYAKKTGRFYSTIENVAIESAKKKGERYSNVQAADFLDLPDLMKESRTGGALVELTIDPKGLPDYAVKRAENYIKSFDSGIYTEDETIVSWNTNYQDIKISPSSIKLARIVDYPTTKYKFPYLYFGLPIDELSRVISERMKFAKEFFDETRRTGKLKGVNLAEFIKQLKVDSIQALIDQTEPLLKAVRAKYPRYAQRITDRQRSAILGRGYGSALYEQAIKEIFGGASDQMVQAVNDYVLARRLKDIYGYKPKYRAQPEYGADQSINATAIFDTLKGIDEAALKVLKRRSPDFEEVFGQLSAEQINDVVRRGETLFNWSRKIVDDLVAAGIKSREEGELLKAHDFRKFKTMSVEGLYDLSYTTRLGNETIKSTNSGVESLGWGSSKIIDPDARISLHEMFMRAYGAIANQAAKQQWEKLALEQPDNGFVMVGPMHNIPEGWRLIKGNTGEQVYVDPDIVTKLSPGTKRVSKNASKVLANYYAQHKDSPYFRVKGKSVPQGWSEMPFYVNGKIKNLYFHPDAAKWLVTRSHDLSKRISTILRYGTLSFITRPLAVGTSPVWSTLVGLPMDVMHTLWTARTWEESKTGLKLTPNFPFIKTTEGKFKKVYNLWDPLQEAKLGADMFRTFNDIYSRGPFFMNLMKHGLAMPFLSMRQGRYMKGTKPPGSWAKFMDVLSYHGTSMEMWVRAATARRVVANRAAQKGIRFEDALKDDDIMYEAVHAARDRMDYNQGGWLTKAADQAGIIFLNAGVLGTRTFLRQAKDNPIDYAFGMIRLGTIAAGITATAWLLYENVMKDVPKEGNETYATFPIFPNYINVKDRNGDTRYFYFKLKMDPNAAFLYKFFEGLTQTYLYDKGLIKEEPDYHRLTQQLKNLGPIGVSAPPLLQFRSDYVTNYSWWKDRQMYTDLGGKTLDWPKSAGEGVFDTGVPQLAKDVGKVTGMSPARLAESATNVIPRNNEFVYLFGKAYEEAFSDVPEELRREHWLLTLAAIPGINRIIGVTQPEYSRWREKEKVQQELDVETVAREGEFDFLVKSHAWYDAVPLEKVTDFIKKQDDMNIVNEMKGELEFALKAKNLPHRNIWLSLYRMSSKGKAKELLATMESSNEAKRKQLMYELGYVRAISGENSGYNSPEFMQAMGKYIEEKKMTPAGVKSLFDVLRAEPKRTVY